MATLKIPVRRDIFWYRQFVTLDNEEYTIVFDYNRRQSSWYISIGDGVLNGIRISGNSDILEHHHYLDVPPGEIKIVDLDGLGREPDADTFGDRVILTYEEA